MSEQESTFSWRVGQGYDVHRLVPNRKLILGGVELQHPNNLGLAGHSDADALLHAITDALLGAAAMGDIGRHFSDKDPRYKNADSRDLLRQTQAMLRTAGWKVVNVDATIIAEQPKLATHIPTMCQHIADDLQIAIDSINVKGKTNECLGYLGRMEGIEAQAVALICRR